MAGRRQRGRSALLLDSARLYGLVTGGPHVNVARCDVILARGKQRGVVPVEAGVDAHIHAIIREGPNGSEPCR
jgi:hypothetical protein